MVRPRNGRSHTAPDGHTTITFEFGTFIRPKAPGRRVLSQTLLFREFRSAETAREDAPGTLAIAPGIPNKRLHQLAVGLIALGVVCRLLRYALRFPYWGDEAFLCVNFLDRGYVGLTQQLECFQVAPLLFLWGELTAMRLLGSSEWAMRLLPLLAGLASLGLFWRLARMSLDLRGAVLAIGILAVARWPVTMCTSVKPYSLDLFFSLSLQVSAFHYLQRPDRVAWLALLTFLVPIALLSSYPAAFVAGSVSLVLLPVVWRNGRFAWTWFLAFNLLMAGTFLGAYLLVGLNQLDANDSSVQRYMQDYWRHGFPPGDFWPFVAWLARINAGRLMAYPIGDARGGSTVTLLLFLVGACVLVGRRRWALLGMCLLPFALNFFAAALHRYPYGGCCRLSQHLAPAICILAATGLCRAIDWSTQSVTKRFRAVCVWCCAFALFGLGEIVADIAKPYRDKEALWSRKISDLLLSRGTEDTVVIGNRQDEVESLLRWHLGRFGGDFSWGGHVDRERLENHSGDLWYVSIWSGPPSTAEVDRHGPSLSAVSPGWTEAEHVTYTLTPWAAQQPLRRCEVSRWIKPGKRPEDSRPMLGAWAP
jgi:hypothetical protein